MTEKSSLLGKSLDEWEDETVEIKEYFPRPPGDAAGKKKFAMALAAVANKAALLDRTTALLIVGARDADRKVIGIDSQTDDKKILADMNVAMIDPPVEVQEVVSVSTEDVDELHKDANAKGVVYIVRISRMRYWPHRVYLDGRGPGKYGIVPCRYGPQVLEAHKEDLLTLALKGARRLQEDTGTLPPQVSTNLLESLGKATLRMAQAPDLVLYLRDQKDQLVENLNVQPEYLRENIIEVGKYRNVPVGNLYPQVTDVFGPKPIPGNFVKIDVAIANEGDGPAENISGFLEFPKDCELKEDAEFQTLTIMSTRSARPTEVWGWYVDEKERLKAQCSMSHLTNELVGYFHPLHVRFPSNGSFIVKAHAVADGAKFVEQSLTVTVQAKKETEVFYQLKPT